MFTFDKEIKNIKFLVAYTEDTNPSYGSPHWIYMPFEKEELAVDFYYKKYSELKTMMHKPTVRVYAITEFKKLDMGKSKKSYEDVKRAIEFLKDRGFKIS